MSVSGDRRALADLAAFARIEVDSRDVEPWADLLGWLRTSGALDAETVAWLVKLYNAYDDLGSAWQVYARWRSPMEWAAALDADEAAKYPCTQERRNLRGGRVLRHLGDYTARLAGDRQLAWLRRPLAGEPQADFVRLTAHLRSVWGVGRQTAFEWAEFCRKCLAVQVEAPDAQLWESEGPRRSLQRLYGNDNPTPGWLELVADICRAVLAERGVPLIWEDFETIVCDYNVARDGRYYPGKHLAALRAEIASVPEHDRPLLEEAWHAVVPSPWCDISPGIDKAKLRVYRDSGVLLDKP